VSSAPATAPAVSVLMVVQDAEAYVGDAVASVLDQTLEDFEFAIYDDGSRDASAGIVDAFAARDARVVLRRRQHAGLATWLREGVDAARAEFVARMDADDVAHPERLTRQLAYLRAHPECVAVGSDVLLVDPERRPIGSGGVQLAHEAIDAELMRGRGTALVHPSVALRRAAVLAAGNYRIGCPWAEDLDLFLRLAERGRLANLPEVLLEYRQHPQTVNATRAVEQRRSVNRVLCEAHERRGLPHRDGTPLPSVAQPPALLDHWTRWARAAIGGGHRATARHYAWRVLRTAPLAWASWRLALRAALGVSLGRARAASFGARVEAQVAQSALRGRS
jgi:glycosyltransferase involved in cell wall biosynthesis